MLLVNRAKFKELKPVIIGIIIYLAILLIFNFWKYYTNKYNVLDLAIYNQVFWNLTHGNGLFSSIQGGNYFGDHAEFLIFLLAPIYALLPHPLTLLALQTIALASAAFPIYFLSCLIFSLPFPQKKGSGRGVRFFATKIYLSLLSAWRRVFKKSLAGRKSTVSDRGRTFSAESEAGLSPLGEKTSGFLKICRQALPTSQKTAPEGSIALIAALLWFINPIVWNINFFEFHILPFAIPLLLWTIYFLLTGRVKLYFLFLFLSLLVREDVALVTLMIGFIGLIKFIRPIRQIRLIGLITALISAAWFLGATKLIQNFSTDDNYKYLSYYSWLGDSFGEIAKNVLLHPLSITKHAATLPNLEMILGFLMVFLFLPLASTRFLLLAMIPLFQFLLGNDGGSALVFQMHYASYFLPALIVSFIFGLKLALQKFPQHQKIIFIVLTIGGIYNFLALGPLAPTLRGLADDLKNTNWKKDNALYSQIPAKASVAATYAPLAKLSSRQNLYALHYLYVGKKQFSRHDYTLAEPPDYLLIDEDELKTFKVQYESLSWSAPTAKDGFNRLKKLIDDGNYGEITRAGNLVLLKKDTAKKFTKYELPEISENLRGYIILNGIRSGNTIFSD